MDTKPNFPVFPVNILNQGLMIRVPLEILVFMLIQIGNSSIIALYIHIYIYI